MNSYVVIALVININNDCVSLVNMQCWSWKQAINCQDVLRAAQSRVWSFFYLHAIEGLQI